MTLAVSALLWPRMGCASRASIPTNASSQSKKWQVATKRSLFGRLSHPSAAIWVRTITSRLAALIDSSSLAITTTILNRACCASLSSRDSHCFTQAHLIPEFHLKPSFAPLSSPHFGPAEFRRTFFSRPPLIPRHLRFTHSTASQHKSPES